MAHVAATRGVALFVIFIQLCLHHNSVLAVQGTKKMDLTLLIDSTLPYSDWNTYLGCFTKIINELSFDSDRMRVSIIGVHNGGQIVTTFNQQAAGVKNMVTQNLYSIMNKAGSLLDIANGIDLADSFPGRVDSPHTVLAVFHKSGLRSNSDVMKAAESLKQSKLNTNLMTIGLTQQIDENLLRNIATVTGSKRHYRHFLTVGSMCNAASVIAKELYQLTPDDGTFIGTPGIVESTMPTTRRVTNGLLTNTTPKQTTTPKAVTPMPLACVNSACIKGSACISGDDANVMLCSQPSDVCARYCYGRLPQPNLGNRPQDSDFPQCTKATKTQTRVYVSSARKYVIVDVTTACPNRGPNSGGTVYHLWGKGLNLSNLKLYFSYGTTKRECLILSKLDDFVQCRTPNVNSFTSLQNRALTLQIYDKTQLVHTETNMFTYKPNPTVTSVSPTKIPIQGGRPLTVKGHNLGNVAEAIYEVRVAYRPSVSGFNAETVYMFASLCNAPNALGREMICPSPVIDLPAHVTDDNIIGSLSAGNGRNSNHNSVFYRIIDLISGRKRRAISEGQISSNQVSMYGRLVLGGMRLQHSDLDKIELFQSPQIELFSGDTKTYDFFPQWPNSEKYIDIPGNFLDVAASASDYNVIIGENSPCGVTEVKRAIIRCMAPEEEPSPALNQPQGQIHPRVTVKYFGKTQYPGFVSYKGMWENNVFKYSLIAAILVLVLLVIILVFVIIFCRLKRNARRKDSNHHDHHNHHDHNDHHDHYHRPHHDSIHSHSNSYKADSIVPERSGGLFNWNSRKTEKPKKVKQPKPVKIKHPKEHKVKKVKEPKMKLEKIKRNRGKLPFVQETNLDMSEEETSHHRPPSPPILPIPEIVPMAASLPDLPPPPPRPPSIVSDHSYRSSKRASTISLRSVISPLLEDLDDPTKVKVQSALIKPELVDRHEEISRGNRGVIYSGRLTRTDGTEESVIIKTFREKDAPKADKVRFIREAAMLRDFINHRYLNVTVAMVIQDEVPFAMSPLMDNGDLKQFLHKIRATHRNEISLRHQLGFARDIAKGMAFLSDHTFVHKDLAARTCVVDKQMNAKVSDIALSRDIYDIDYYWVDRMNASLPFKWMALEGLERFIFSTKTDVWSFGILLWEIMTLGGTPYTDVDTSDLKRYLKKGNRLEQPDHTPDSVYSIMDACWQSNPDRRPKFVAIVDTLEELQAESEGITIMGSGEVHRDSRNVEDVFMM